MIYLFVYFLLLLFGSISRRNVSFRRALYYFCLIGLFLFVGFRYDVGCDWSGYLNIFELARHETRGSEVAFWYVNKLLHYFELEYPYINIVAAFVFFLGLHALAKRQPDPLSVLILAFPILILELAMSGIRQAIAVGFLCFAYNAFVDSRLLGFILFVMVATSFHSSAMVFLLLAPFMRGELSVRRVALGGLLALPGLYFFLTSATFETYSQRYIGTASDAAGAPLRSGLLALTGDSFPVVSQSQVEGAVDPGLQTRQNIVIYDDGDVTAVPLLFGQRRPNRILPVPGSAGCSCSVAASRPRSVFDRGRFRAICCRSALPSDLDTIVVAIRALLSSISNMVVGGDRRCLR